MFFRFLETPSCVERSEIGNSNSIAEGALFDHFIARRRLTRRACLPRAARNLDGIPPMGCYVMVGAGPGLHRPFWRFFSLVF